MNKGSEYRIKLLNLSHLGKDYYCFDFTKPAGFTFTEGQFGLFGLVGKEVEGRQVRAFSIVSTNEEPFIRVATRIVETPSDFKKKMLELSPGDEISMNAPLGVFSLNEGYDAVFIAGGIGITPIRSMLLSNKRMKRNRHDTLIYSELDENYPFKAEIEKLPNLEILFAADIQPTQQAIIQTVSKHQNNAFYYLSGSPGFVAGISALLERQGIEKECIKHDIFTGY